ERGVPRLDRGPRRPAVSIFGDAALKASLVFVRTRVARVLDAIGLGKENPDADAARAFRIRGIEALGARDRRAEIGDVPERRIRFLRVRGRRIEEVENPVV